MAGQVWTTNTLGGYLSAKNLSDVLRFAVQPMVKYRQLCDVKDGTAKGAKKRGDKFHWDVFSNVATAGSALTETVAMPSTNFTIAQGELTVTEYGNSVPYSGKLDALSELPVKDIIEKVLKQDCVKTLDNAAYQQFNATPLRVAPAAGTDTSAVVLSTTGSTTITNNVQLRLDHVKNITDIMKERNIPAYIGDDYIAVFRPATIRPLKNDLEAVYKYADTGFGMLLNGEIGRYDNMRFVEQTNIPSAAWTNGKSDAGFFMGEDTVTEAIVVPEEMRGMIPGDFGRSMGVAWYYLGGFGLTQTSASNARVIKWDSAA